MNRTLIFTRRNIKELLASPVGWGFGLAFPIGLFIIMQVIIKAIGPEAAAMTPMFGVQRFTGGVLIFSAAFLSMFISIIIASDRGESFLPRLLASPMRPREFIIGYMLGILPIALAQNVIIIITALCFGLTPTVNILPAMLFALIFSMLFIGIGMIFGSALPVKSATPLCSAVVQIAALLSGMWFDLEAIGGGFNTFCHVLPFAHYYDIVRYTLEGNWQNVWQPFLVLTAYTVVILVAAVVIFKKKSENV